LHGKYVVQPISQTLEPPIQFVPRAVSLQIFESRRIDMVAGKHRSLIVFGAQEYPDPFLGHLWRSPGLSRNLPGFLLHTRTAG
jgi:hypothetical protein